MSDLIKRLETNVKETKAKYIAMDHRTDLRDYARAAADAARAAAYDTVRAAAVVRAASAAAVAAVIAARAAADAYDAARAAAYDTARAARAAAAAVGGNFWTAVDPIGVLERMTYLGEKE